MKRLIAYGGVTFCFALLSTIGSAHEVAVRAQQQTVTRPVEFEVASIKASKPGSSPTANRVMSACHGTDSTYPTLHVAGLFGGAPFILSPPPLGRCMFQRYSVRTLINIAYGRPAMRLFPGGQLTKMIVGGPDWLDTDDFDIEAEAEDPSTTNEAQLLEMLQTLLADRFKLKFHRETRELPEFTLVAAKNGPKLTEASADEPFQGFQNNGRQMIASKITLPRLVDYLQNGLDSPIIDKTGLTAAYDIRLSWTPGAGDSAIADLPTDVAAEIGAKDPGPSLFTALQDDLGLRLESTKVPVNVIVVDYVEKPTESQAAKVSETTYFEDATPNPTSKTTSVSKVGSSVAILSLISAKLAETATPSPLAFEVASIKALPDSFREAAGGGCRRSDNPTQFAAGPYTMGIGRCLLNGTLKGLINAAYDLHLLFAASGKLMDPDRITGGMSWTDSDRFRVEAKSEDPPVSHAQLLQMLQTLLVEQFKLKVHRGTKEVPGFVLLVAKSGPKLKEPADDEPKKVMTGHIGKQGQLTGQATTASLAEALSAMLGSPVADQTGLTDRYEINLKWTSDEPGGAAAGPSDPVGPSIFTAVQEQLGLRLKAQKSPVEILIIDHAEKPLAPE